VDIARSLWEEGKAMRTRRGFSLIELLIVVAIILIIAAIAIPNLLRARMAANESSAVASIRTLNTAENSYIAAYPTTAFAATIGALGPPNATTCATPNSTNACLIDFTLSTATAASGKNGYIFNIATFSSTAYAAAGTATSWNETGVRSFCSVGDATIRYKVETATVPPTTYTGSLAACTALAGLQ
jgi:prepilin-type N-terminal cleavage/methylation domain-containing protein